MSAKALLNANPRPTADEARAAMTGNICRCANYSHYVAATVAASQPTISAGQPAIAALKGPRYTRGGRHLLRVPRFLR